MFLIYKGGKDFYQWDMGQRLQIVDENYNRVHFCTKKCTSALVCNVYTENGVRLVNVPNILLQEPCIVKAYGCIAEGGEIYYAKEAQYFRVIERAKPDDYIYTEEEIKNWNGIDERLAQIEEDVAELEAIGYDNLARKTEVKAVENRLDNAIAATTLDSNTELKDIRVGANGESYTNAGNAVRAKVNKTDILSSFGDSEDKVVSQKAVSKKFNTLEGKVSKNEKQIANLINAREQELFIEDDTVAYVKEVPEKVLPYAEIGEIGGMTRKCTNLFYMNGIDFNNAVNTGTLNARIIEAKYKINTQYRFSWKSTYITGATGILLYLIVSYTDGTNTEYTHAVARSSDNKSYKCVITESGKTVQSMAFIFSNHADFIFEEIMLTEGTEEKPYEPYYKGLRDAKVTAVESDSINMCNLARIPDTLNGLTFAKNTDGSVTINGTCNAYTTIYFEKINIKTGEKFYFLGGQKGTTFTINGNMGGTFIRNLGTADDTSIQAITCDGTYDNFYPILLIQAGVVLSNVTVRFMVSKTPFTSFSPYFKNTFPIPEAVQALEGYGQGVNKEYCNKIVLDTATGVKKYVKRVGEVDLGTLHWDTSYNIYLIGYVSYRKNGFRNFIVEGGEVAPTYNGSFDDSFPAGTWGGVYNSPSIVYRMYDGEYADANAFQTAMQGKKLIFELETPVETDITDLITDDNFIGVESGGTITAVNEYKLDAPSVITYQLKEV